MGRVWSVDAVAKNASTSFYGNIVVARRVAADGGPALRRHRRRADPGDRGRRRALAEGRAASRACPRCTYVSRLERLAPRRRRRSTPRSTTTRWATSSPTCCEHRPRPDAGPRSPATCPSAARSTRSREDHVEPEPALRRHRVRPLLHARRRQASGSSSRAACRPIAVRDLAIQRRENDLVVGHLRPRLLRPRRLLAAAPRRRAAAARRGGRRCSRCKPRWLYIPAVAARRARTRPFQGESLLHRAQPAVRRHLHLLPEGRAQDPQKQRRRSRRRRSRRRAATSFYPTWDTLRAEDARGGRRRSCSP